MNIIKEKKTTDNDCSSSRCLAFAGTVITEKNGDPLNGQYTLRDGTIVCFRNGLLDGNIYDDEGNRIFRCPAVEYEYGGIEFWEKGLLNGFPAVIQSFGYLEEDWDNGQIKAIRNEARLVNIVNIN